MAIVLDASALLALINQEPGAERVAGTLGEAQMSAVNLSEVAGKLVDKGIDSQMVDEDLGGIGVSIVGFDRAAALSAARLRRLGRNLSIGDRACLALGVEVGGTVLTADHDWAVLQVPGVRIVTIR
ncbi:MAG: type II toxin-antitoxin system VapC family toxin [Candidatus Dormibacterales bacterium]